MLIFTKIVYFLIISKQSSFLHNKPTVSEINRKYKERAPHGALSKTVIVKIFLLECHLKVSASMERDITFEFLICKVLLTPYIADNLSGLI